MVAVAAAAIAIPHSYHPCCTPMVSPALPQFRHLATQGNFVPVYQELAADLDTPVSAWHKVCGTADYSFL